MTLGACLSSVYAIQYLLGNVDLANLFLVINWPNYIYFQFSQVFVYIRYGKPLEDDMKQVVASTLTRMFQEKE